MKKLMKKIFAMALGLAMVFTSLSLPTQAQGLEGRTGNAYICYANTDWSIQNWAATSDETTGVKVTSAQVDGNGTYTVGLDFTGTANGKAEGVAFADVMIDNGSGLFPGAIINIKSIKINGADVEFTKGYTSSDDQKELRFNIYNEWVTELPADARTADGDLTDASAIVVPADAFASVETMEVEFEVTGADTDAYLVYADPNWAVQYWGGADVEGVKATTAHVSGNGTYTVGLDFDTPVTGTAFTALYVDNLETLAPGCTITIDKVEINGAEVEVGNYYTSSDDQVVTRVNLYNEWVTEIPDDARRADDVDAADFTAEPLAQDLFTDVTSYYVTFTVAGATPNAYIAYADSAWAIQNWGVESSDAVKVTSAVITGEGQYTVGLEFTDPAPDVAFTALMIDNGENILPGWFYTLDSVKINGAEVELGKEFTTSDDAVVTRVNLYNEWVGEIPAEARRADGDLTDATATPVSKEAFTDVSSIEVTFTATWGAKPVAAEETSAEVDYEYSGTYHAYLGCQTNTELWIFRNAWSDASYGANGTENAEAFNGLYDTTNNAFHDGTFTDVEITGDGTYTVSLTGADFGSETNMSQLFVSTDMPYASKITFTDVHVKINGVEQYTTDEGHISKDIKKEGQYLAFHVQNIWDDAVTDLFAINFPVTDIEITFTVNGMGYEKAAEEVVETPVETPVETVVAEEPASSNSLIWVWVVVGVAVVAGAVVAVVVVNNKKKGKKETK